MSNAMEKIFGPLPEDVIKKIESLPNFAEPGSDPDEFGFGTEGLKVYASLMLFFYKNWFRVEIDGIENVPDRGPAIIVPNHSGQLPMDGGMIATACMLEKEHPRVPRAMIEKWFPTLPIVSTLMARCGQVVGVTENAERLLERGELLMIFPEGMKGSGKLWKDRYRLQKFAMGFMELSIRYNAPIIPAAVIGGEEQAPSFYNVEPLAKKLGMPYFPLTPQFPWLGLLGFLPFPSKYRIYIGEPMDFSGHKSDLDSPEAIRMHVDVVRDKVQQMVDEGLKKRPFPFF